MQVYVSGRQGGKTHEAVRWVLKGAKRRGYPGWTRVMLVTDVQRADQVRREYPALDYRQVFSFKEWLEARGRTFATEVIVDNADEVLSNLLHWRVSAATFTGSIMEIEPPPTQEIEQ
jgi:hypothetical protein